MNYKLIKEKIFSIIPEEPLVGIILGSGLGLFTSLIKEKISIPYSSIPDFPQTSTTGHAGEWVFGYVNQKPIIVANGRFHYYEGFSLDQVTSTVSTIFELGCNNLIITNAAGCLNLKWNIGEFMLIKGYLDYTFRNGSELSEIRLFNKIKLQENIIKIIKENEIKLHEGIYAWTLGPSYETHAEIQDLISNGISAVGMSTVPEVLVANHCGIPVVAISVITNLAAGMNKTKLSHHETLTNASLAEKNIISLLKTFIETVLFHDSTRNN